MSETEHFPGCHPEDDEDTRDQPDGYQPQDTEDCWHCGTPTPRGCRCWDCLDVDDTGRGMYHCPVCRRWWGYMTLRVTKITFGDEDG